MTEERAHRAHRTHRMHRVHPARPVVWARPERASRGPAPSRSRQQIAAAAVALADAEGVETLSMRKVAASLGVAAASLYGYVDSKDELYDLMVDHVEGEDGPPPPTSGDWRTDLSVMAHKIRGSVIRHPWLASITASRHSFGPNSLRWVEHGLAALDGLGLEIDGMLVASEVLQAFVRGFVTRELAEQQGLHRTGLSAQQCAQMIAPYLEAIVAGGEHPRFARVVRDARLPHAEDRQQMLFEAALERVLDGLAPRSTGTPPALTRRAPQA